MRRNKVVIYTAIAGGGDGLIQHQYRSPEFDYVCFSDCPIDEPGMWEVRLMQDTFLDDVRKAKYYKFFPNALFPDHLYSVWIDGNIDVLDNSLEKRVIELIDSDSLMAANIHPQRTCAYEEANACINLGKDDLGVILRQIDYMKTSGLPRDAGLYALMIIYRKHQNREVIHLMDEWWWMIENFSRRDQISFIYVLYKRNMNCEVLFERDIYADPAFSFKKHATVFYVKLMVDTGGGFNYKNMVTRRYVTDGASLIEMEFDLSDMPEFERIQLYPFDTGVGGVKLNSISLQDFDCQDIRVDIKKIRSNGILQADGYLTFKTFGPTIDIPVSGCFQKIVISGIFKVENQVVSKQIISRELERVNSVPFVKFGKEAFSLLRKFTRL